MKMNLHVKAEIAGKVVYEKEFDPWCLAWAAWVHGYRYSMINYSAPDVANVSRSVLTALRFNAASAIDTFGPVVGTNSTAWAFSNYNLGVKVAHGTGAGQLSYGVVSFNAPTTLGNDRYFEVVRVFTNSSGAEITIYEVGMIGFGGTYYHLVCRDVIGAGLAIPNGQALTLTYKVKISL